LPAVPPASSRAPIDIAMPMQYVCTSGFTNCIASYIAIPAYTSPPGELM
jgi:hypothetical protein